MPNIAQVLKEEISRISRKQVRSDLEALRRGAAQQRSAIAALKRTVTALQRELAQVRRRAARASAAEPEAGKAGDGEGVRRRFSPERLAAHRAKLELSAKDYARLVGVSALSIYHWESGKTRPRPAQLEALAQVRSLGKREAAAKLAQ